MMEGDADVVTEDQVVVGIANHLGGLDLNGDILQRFPEPLRYLRQGILHQFFKLGGGHGNLLKQQ